MGELEDAASRRLGESQAVRAARRNLMPDDVPGLPELIEMLHKYRVPTVKFIESAGTSRRPMTRPERRKAKRLYTLRSYAGVLKQGVVERQVRDAGSGWALCTYELDSISERVNSVTLAIRVDGSLFQGSANGLATVHVHGPAIVSLRPPEWERVLSAAAFQIVSGQASGMIRING